MSVRGLMRVPLLVLLLVPLLVVATEAAARADTLEGARFEHRRMPGGQELLLSGMHLSRWAGVIKVSVSALWLPADAVGRDALAPDVGKQLEIHYLARIPGNRLREGTRGILARNWPASVLARHARELDPVVDAFGDVAPGDRYTLTYLPGSGVTLAFNGRPVVRSDSDAVAALLFSVWLGASPLDEDKKRALLAYRLHRQAPSFPGKAEVTR